MKEFFQLIRRKLSVRVSLWVVLFAAIIFNVALGFLFFQSRDAVREEAVNHAMQILDKTSLRVEGILNRVEVASNMTTWLVQRHPDKPDSMFVTSRPTPSMTATASEPYRAAATSTNISSWTGTSCPCCSTSLAGRSHTWTMTWLRTRARW